MNNNLKNKSLFTLLKSKFSSSNPHSKSNNAAQQLNTNKTRKDSVVLSQCSVGGRIPSRGRWLITRRDPLLPPHLTWLEAGRRGPTNAIAALARDRAQDKRVRGLPHVRRLGVGQDTFERYRLFSSNRTSLKLLTFYHITSKTFLLI
jgi:hypothetical protein